MIRHTGYAGPQKLNCQECEPGRESVESDFARPTDPSPDTPTPACTAERHRAPVHPSAQILR